MTAPLHIQVKALIKRYFLMDFRRNKGALLRDFLPPLLVGFFIWVITRSSNPANQVINILPFFFPLGSNGIIRGFLYDLVNEKSEKFKEYLKINGSTETAYTLSILLYGYFKSFLNSLFILLAILISNPSNFEVDNRYGAIQLWIAYVGYGIVTINSLMAYSTFFSSAKLASDTGGLLATLAGYLYFLIRTEQNPSFWVLSAIIPQIWVNNAINVALGNPGDYASLYSASESWIIFAIDFCLYGLLYVYLERVLPNEYGIKKSACFCFKRASKNKQRLSIHNKSIEKSIKGKENTALSSPLVNNDCIQLSIEDEDYSSAKFHQAFNNVEGLKGSLVIRKLRKTFKDYAAVNELSLTMYEKQIFCLLGHNGAGKTTTINILTGILNADSGDIYYDDENFREDFDQIRTKIGLCAQKDLLYNELTIEEHLDMIATIRGVSKDILQQEIEDTIVKVGLEKERGKQAGNLSGGNKRKLSLGMAIIGGVKFVFLDEPTSGMDPNSRRVIWDIIRFLRNEGKTILLTTHYLEEADELADRIGVMTKGQLFCLGTSDFLKKQFGAGYQLVLTPRAEVSLETFNSLKPRMDGIIMSNIQNMQKNDQTPPEIVKYLLPFNYQSSFGKIFSELEKLPEIIISLEMNTLEDAFINIGLDEDKFLGISKADEELEKNKEIIPPASIGKNPEYKFSDQFYAIFLRKYYSTIRSPISIIMTILPIGFIVIAVLVAKTYLDADNLQQTSGVFNAYISNIVLGFALNASIFCGFPVWEREFRLRYALKVMGCHTTAYWLGTFAFDLIIASILVGILVAFTGFEQIPLITDNNNLGLVFLILFAFALDVVACSYLYGFMFSKSNTAFKTIGIFNYFILYFTPYVIVMLLSNELPNSPLDWPYNIVKIVAFAFSPFYMLYDALMTLVPYDVYSITVHNLLMPQWYYYFLLMLGQTALFIGFVILLESRKYKLKDQVEPANILPFSDKVIIDVEEINAENLRVSHPDNNDPIKILNLKKIYPNGFQAVRTISVGVEKGQIFGLLGPNGAGKSTTFNILTSLVPKTSGSVKLLNQEINTDMEHIFKEVGICPQFDCLWENLTVKEHLMLFGRMKGLHGVELNENIDYYIKVMSLQDHENKKSTVLSGGNKRKLCVTNALIGSPSLQFFDEPSTGLDPVARRFLWTTLTQNIQNRNASIVLTTHSMPEAESLCNKIGILINGQFVCFGSTPYLKNKYGDGYKITIQKSDKLQEDLSNLIVQCCPQSKRVIDPSQLYETYQIPLQGFSFSKTFTYLESLKANGHILDFSIYNTTLEQVFINFSKYQYVSES